MSNPVNPGAIPSPRTDITPGSRSGVDSNNNPTLEPERKCRGTMLNLDPARRVGVIIGMQSQERAGLHNTKGRPLNPHARAPEYEEVNSHLGQQGC